MCIHIYVYTCIHGMCVIIRAHVCDLVYTFVENDTQALGTLRVGVLEVYALALFCELGLPLGLGCTAVRPQGSWAVGLRSSFDFSSAVGLPVSGAAPRHSLES